MNNTQISKTQSLWFLVISENGFFSNNDSSVQANGDRTSPSALLTCIAENLRS